MDALTNVVAVLILVLVLVQADVTRKVVRFIEDMQPATPEQLAQLENDVAQATLRKDSLNALLNDAASSAARLDEANRELDRVRAQLADADRKLAEAKEAKSTEARLRSELDAQEKANEQILNRIESLKDKLGQVKESKVVAPKQVSIPEIRPIPESAVIHRALCNANRIHIVDTTEALDIVRKEFDRHSKNWIHKRVTRDKKEIIVYDQSKIAAHFKKAGLKNARGQSINVITNPREYYLLIEVSPDFKNGGTPMEELEKKGSEFYNNAIRMKADSRAVLMYHVHPDSYDCYLKARDLSDKARIPAGWEVGSPGKWREIIRGIGVNRLEEPPANKPAGPKQPPRVESKLD